MRLKPALWGLAGGLVGLVFGLFVVAVSVLERPAAATRLPALPTGPPQGAPPPSSGGTYAMDVGSMEMTMTLQEVLRPLVDAGQTDKALAAIDELGDAGTGSGEFRDQNLGWLARAIVGADESALDPDEGDGEQAEETSGDAGGAPPGPGDGESRDASGREADGSGAGLGEARGPKMTEPRKPRDFAKAEEVAAMIRSPLIRASTLVEVGNARKQEQDPAVKGEADADFQKAYDALRQVGTRVETSSRAYARALDARNAVWLAGPSLLGMILFGLGARALNSVADRFQRGMADEVDREVGARLKANPT